MLITSFVVCILAIISFFGGRDSCPEIIQWVPGQWLSLLQHLQRWFLNLTKFWRINMILLAALGPSERRGYQCPCQCCVRKMYAKKKGKESCEFSSRNIQERTTGQSWSFLCFSDLSVDLQAKPCLKFYLQSLKLPSYYEITKSSWQKHCRL